MSLIRRLLKALRDERVRAHKRWLRRNRVLMPPPDPKCQRDGVQSVP